MLMCVMFNEPCSLDVRKSDVIGSEAADSEAVEGSAGAAMACDRGEEEEMERRRNDWRVGRSSCMRPVA